MNKLNFLEQLGSVEIPLFGKLGQGKFTLVDDDYDGEYFGLFKWYLSPAGYVCRYDYEHYYDTKKHSYIYLHREVARPPRGFVTDHINRDRLDNRSANLRWATHAQNNQNRGRINGKNLPKGVSRADNGFVRRDGSKLEGNYKATIRQKYIGIYGTPEAAAKAYDVRAIKEFGNFATLNFPDA